MRLKRRGRSTGAQAAELYHRELVCGPCADDADPRVPAVVLFTASVTDGWPRPERRTVATSSLSMGNRLVAAKEHGWVRKQ